ncbi:hypothetical protein, partial [Pseudomonas aeruginosa]|uniref:hypothetical protein n=1 Tax=Pseudomonas aeruginosa TaxID=287 RepID=UPI001C6A2D5B
MQQAFEVRHGAFADQLQVEGERLADGDDREFGKNRTLSFASSCNQFIVFSMDERKWRKLFDKQIGIL